MQLKSDKEILIENMVNDFSFLIKNNKIAYAQALINILTEEALWNIFENTNLLWTIAKYGKTELLKSLQTKLNLLEMLSRHHYEPIVHAARFDQLDIIKYVLEELDPDLIFLYGEVIVRAAKENGHLQIVDYIIDTISVDQILNEGLFNFLYIEDLEITGRLLGKIPENSQVDLSNGEEEEYFDILRLAFIEYGIPKGLSFKPDEKCNQILQTQLQTLYRLQELPGMLLSYYIICSIPIPTELLTILLTLSMHLHHVEISRDAAFNHLNKSPFRKQAWIQEENQEEEVDIANDSEEIPSALALITSRPNKRNANGLFIAQAPTQQDEETKDPRKKMCLGNNTP